MPLEIWDSDSSSESASPITPTKERRLARYPAWLSWIEPDVDKEDWLGEDEGWLVPIEEVDDWLGEEFTEDYYEEEVYPPLSPSALWSRPGRYLLTIWEEWEMLDEEMEAYADLFWDVEEIAPAAEDQAKESASGTEDVKCCEVDVGEVNVGEVVEVRGENIFCA